MTNYLDFLLRRFELFGTKEALAFRDEIMDYATVLENVQTMIRRIERQGMGPSDVVLLEADYSFQSVTLLLALLSRNFIVAPITPDALARTPDLKAIVSPDFQCTVKGGDVSISGCMPVRERHELELELRVKRVPGLILFTSGSSGRPKAVVHNFSLLVEKFKAEKRAFRTVNFLLFDHWGGLNTLFHNLANGSFLVLPEQRNPSYVCGLIEKYQLSLLPVSPTFLNLMVASNCQKEYRLDSLRVITYGAEPMPESTLKRLTEILPDLEFKQTYGLIELGVMQSKSKAKDSLWVKLGGEGFDIRVVDGLLEIKAKSGMLGYLNAPSPYTDDGYFRTGDRVLQDGEYYRILGRDSEIINVGGLKVFPQEIESVLLEHSAVEDVTVFGQKHPLAGMIICADVKKDDRMDERDTRLALKKHCMQYLEAFKVPMKFNFIETELYSARLKRIRVRDD